MIPSRFTLRGPGGRSCRHRAPVKGRGRRPGVTSVGGWVGKNNPHGQAAKFMASHTPCSVKAERAVCGSEPPNRGAQPQAVGAHLRVVGCAAEALPAADAARRSRGSGGDRVRWTKQGAVVGCVAEPLPAAETGEAEQGQRRRPHPVDDTGRRRWRSGLNMQASALMRRIFRAPQEECRPNMQAGCDPRCIFGQRQPGAALQFSQGRSAARRENWLSARGTRSAFCKRATSRAAKTGHRNPGGLDEK